MSTDYIIEMKNGFHRVYRHSSGGRVGLRSFKTRKGAENFIKRLTTPRPVQTIVSEPVLRGGQWCVIAREGRSPIAPETILFSSTSRETAYQAYREARKEQGKGL